MKNKVNCYKNVTQPTIVDTIEIKDWLNQIKTPNETVRDIINLARKVGKYNEDNTKNEYYEGLKKILPCITYNFLFNNYKKDENVLYSTGLMFIDIDNKDFDINIIDKSKIFSFYRSLDNNGYHLIVKVNNVTNSNFKKTYLSISNDLGILEYIDRNAIKKSQFTVLSFDENIFINDDCFIYDSLGNKNIELNDKKVRHNDIIKKEDEIGCPVHFLDDDKFIKLKFKSQLEKYDDNCVKINEGEHFYECFIPYSIHKNKRVLTEGQKHKTLTCYINNLIYLNPNISRHQLIVTIKAVANRSHNLMIPNENLIKIVDNKLKQQREGTLKPIGNKIKYYWISPDVENKLKVYHDKLGERTKDLLYNFFADEILNLNCRITNRLISKKTGLCTRTLKRRMTPEMIELVNKHNENFLKK